MSSGLFSEIKRLSVVGFPIIGICLGFQLMTVGGSEEAPFDPGLNIFPYSTVEIKPQFPIFKVPHIGWNSLDLTKSDTPLFHQIILQVRVDSFLLIDLGLSLIPLLTYPTPRIRIPDNGLL